MDLLNKTSFSFSSETSRSATHLLHGVQCFDPSFRECELSATSVYVPASSKLGVGGVHGNAREREICTLRGRFAAVRRCGSFRSARIVDGAARETEGNTCNEMPAFVPFAPHPGRCVTPRERRRRLRSWEHSAVLHFSTKSAVNVPTDAPRASIYDR